MGRYLKTAYLREQEYLVDKGEISYGKMVENIENEVIKNMTLEQLKQLAESKWEGCDGCDENDKYFWIGGFIAGVLQTVDLDIEQPKTNKNEHIHD